LKEEIGAHAVWAVPYFGAVHSDTVVTTWIVMVLTLAFLGYVGASYRGVKANKLQTIFEGVVETVADTVHGSLGKAGEAFVPFYLALFVFLFACNQFGMFPAKSFGLPFGGSPTADINTTFSLALAVWVMIHVTGLGRKGLRYFAHLAQPFPAVLPLNILDELLRPVTLAARLFFNIFIGELLPIIIASILLPVGATASAASVVSYQVLMFGVQFLGFAVGAIQAFVFSLLGVVYMSLNLAEDH
jgi:F-type H+-transporting ATPase subunit a